MAVMLLEWVFTSAFLILVVLALRAALGRRMSAGLRYALWAVVLVRLLVPVQLFTSPIAGTRVFSESVRPQNIYKLTDDGLEKGGPEDIEALGKPDGPTVILNTFPQAPNPPVVPDAPEPPAAPDLTKAPVWLGWVWLAGSAAVALVLLASNLRFFWRLRRVRIPLDEADHPLRVYVAVGLPSPCLFGLIRPAVYVTPEAAANPDMLRHVLAHEYTHYRHGDHIWSLLRCAALAAHWWNPLVWLAARLSQRDGELACDEGALKRLGDGERAAYGGTLLALVTAKPRPGDLFRCATTMAGDKKSLRERIGRIACAPKRVLWAVVVAVLVTALACLCAFGQAEPEADDPVPSHDPAVSAQPSQEPETYDEHEWIISYFVPDVTDVPEDVLHFVGKAVQEKYNEYMEFLDRSLLRDKGIRFDDWRVERLGAMWRGVACGMELEIWEINCEFHTTTPEAAEENLIYEKEGGPYLTEDGWLCPYSPYLTYAVFQVNEAGTRALLTTTEAFGVTPGSVDFVEWAGEVLAKKGLVDPTKLTDVDLNRNGVPETLQISMINGGAGQRLDVWEGDELLFSEEGYYAHAGYNALFLYRDGDGQYYLLRYNPYMGQGWCTYRYQMFTLSKNGEEQVKWEGSVEFDIDFSPINKQHSFDPEEIAAFMEEVNVLLNHSVQLINTDSDLLDTFLHEGRLVDTMWSLLHLWEPPFVLDQNKPLVENLREFQAAMEGSWYTEYPWVVAMNETEENAHIWLRYQDKSTEFDVDCWAWNYQPPEEVEAQVVDLNHDGRDEIVLPLVWGHGTGAYIQKLYVFDAETLEQYDTEGLNDAILNSIESTGDEDNFYLKGPGMAVGITLNKHAPRDNPDAPVGDAILLGNIVRYTVSDGTVYCWLGCDMSEVCLNYEGYMKVWLDFSLGGSFKCVHSAYVGEAPWEM